MILLSLSLIVTCISRTVFADMTYPHTSFLDDSRESIDGIDGDMLALCAAESSLSLSTSSSTRTTTCASATAAARGSGWETLPFRGGRAGAPIAPPRRREDLCPVDGVVENRDDVDARDAMLVFMSAFLPSQKRKRRERRRRRKNAQQ